LKNTQLQHIIRKITSNVHLASKIPISFQNIRLQSDAIRSAYHREDIHVASGKALHVPSKNGAKIEAQENAELFYL